MGSCVGTLDPRNNATNVTALPALDTEIVFRPQDETAHQFVYYCEAVVIPVINLIGVITNSISLYILPKTRIVETFKICLIALTICDLLASLIAFTNMMLEIGFYDGDLPFGYWQPAAVASYTLYYITNIFICTSATYVMTIVLLRHWIIKSPMRARAYLTASHTKKACFWLFLITVTLYLPTSLNILWQSCHNDKETEICVSINHSIPNLETITKSYLYSLMVIYGPIMVVLYIVSLVGIKLNLMKHERRAEDLSEHTLTRENKVRVQRTLRITRLLLIILLVDIICMLPVCAQAITVVLAPKTTVFCPTNVASRVFDVVAEIFYNLRPTYNFWLYAFQHAEFRYLLINFLCCCRCKSVRQSIMRLTSVPSDAGRSTSVASYHS